MLVYDPRHKNYEGAKDCQVIRAVENKIKMDKSKARLSMMTKGKYDPCEDCEELGNIGRCEFCGGSSLYQGFIEMLVFYCPADGQPCGMCVLIKSFYKATDCGIAEHKYAVCSYNCSGQKDEWCFDTLRKAVRAAENWLTTHGYRILGYVGNDHKRNRWSSLRH